MGPGDRAFLRWARRYTAGRADRERVLRAYKKAKLIAVDNHTGAFCVLDHAAVQPDALEAAVEQFTARDAEAVERAYR